MGAGQRGGAINSRVAAFESPLRPAGRALRIFEDRKRGFAQAARETIVLFQVKVKQVQMLLAQLPYSLFQTRPYESLLIIPPTYFLFPVCCEAHPI